MKKLFSILLCVLFLVTGCGKKNDEKVIDKFSKNLENASSYHLKASMDISSDEDTFNYDVEVYYMKDDYYKVSLKNNVNNHKQVILKNDEGVYVITPSLNKSFKFQSDWPHSSSQSYLLTSILADIKDDEELVYTEEDGYYVYECEVSYPNNVELKYQKVYFDKNKDIKMVKVYNASDIVKINVEFKEIDYKASIKVDDFKIENNIEDENVSTETTSSLEDIIYPLYIPADTYLSSRETITTDVGERVILTFSGSKNFVLVEEVSKANEEFEIIPVYGEPLMLSNTIGALSANSLSWSFDNVDFYLTSSDLSNQEMVSVAHSLNATDMIVGK